MKDWIHLNEDFLRSYPQPHVLADASYRYKLSAAGSFEIKSFSCLLRAGEAMGYDSPFFLFEDLFYPYGHCQSHRDSLGLGSIYQKNDGCSFTSYSADQIFRHTQISVFKFALSCSPILITRYTCRCAQTSQKCYFLFAIDFFSPNRSHTFCGIFK